MIDFVATIITNATILYVMPASSDLAVQDAAAACVTLELATQKFQASLDFARGDVAPHNALGDAHANWADRLLGNEAIAHLQQSLQAYQQALHIDSSGSDAYIGIAEKYSRMGRLAVTRDAVEDAMQCFRQAAEAYSRVLQWPTKLGKFQERCEIRYNLACMLSICSRHEEAIRLLHELVKVHGVSANDLQSDADLSNLRSIPAFQQLLHQIQAT